MSNITVDVRGLPEVKEALDKLGGAPMKRTLQKASTAGARALKKPVQAAAPRQTGRLRKSVSARQARKDRPAAVVSARPKVAFYRHMVIGGTKPHGPRKATMLVFKGRDGLVRTKHVRGTPSRPFISEGFADGRRDAEAAIDKVMDEYLASL